MDNDLSVDLLKQVNFIYNTCYDILTIDILDLPVKVRIIHFPNILLHRSPYLRNEGLDMPVVVYTTEK